MAIDLSVMDVISFLFDDELELNLQN